MLRCLIASFPSIARIDSLAKDGVMNAGYNATVLGLPGMDPLAEEMMLWRDIQLVKKTGHPLPRPAYLDGRFGEDYSRGQIGRPAGDL